MTTLGIDGGGSKTTFLLVDDEDRELARFDTGPSNYISVGRDRSVQAIADGVGKLPSQPDQVCGGFAGAGRPEGRRHYQAALVALLPDSRVTVESDAFIAYVGAIGIRPGLLLIAGTGSIVIGRRENGTMFRSGGWGPQFGDEGSGYWIGREAVRAALRSLDSGSHERFRQRVTDTLGLESITHTPAAWAEGRIGAPAIAALVPAVIDFYPNEPAKTILEEAAGHLRVMAQRAVMRMGGDAPHTAATGGVATHPLMQDLIAIPFEPAIDTPERGAVLWARQTVVSP